MTAAGGGSRSQRAAERLAGDGGEEPPAGSGRGEGTPEESPARVPRPIQARLVLPRPLPGHPLGPAGARWLGHAPPTGAGTRVPEAGPAHPPCRRLGFEVRAERTQAVSSSFHSGYFCNPQSLTGPVSKASNSKSPSSAGPFLPSSAPAGPQPSLTPATRAERPRGSPRTPGPK